MHVLKEPADSRPHHDHFHVRLALPGDDAVAGCVLVTGVMTLAGLWLSDFLQAWLDPRVRDGAR